MSFATFLIQHPGVHMLVAVFGTGYLSSMYWLYRLRREVHAVEKRWKDHYHPFDEKRLKNLEQAFDRAFPKARETGEPYRG